MPEIDPEHLAIAAMQLRAEASFRRTKEILQGKGIDLLLLKGPHLGSTVYDSPAERLYADLDILVRERDFVNAAAALADSGFAPLGFREFSPEVQEDFKHWEYRSPWGTTIELHRWLSGHDRFAIDSDGLFARAEPFVFGETPARGLGSEDLFLHLCLHMGTSYFKLIESKHPRDISLLLNKRALDWKQVVRRARRSGSRAIVYYSLQAARQLHGAVVPEEVLAFLRPGWLRRCWLERFIDPSSFPIYRHPGDSWKKAKWLLLLPLMDRPKQWIIFFIRMARGKLRMVGRKMGVRS